MIPIKINLNDHVTVTLNADGAYLWNEHVAEVRRRIEEPDYLGFKNGGDPLTLPLWEFIRIFGDRGNWTMGRPGVLADMNATVAVSSDELRRQVEAFAEKRARELAGQRVTEAQRKCDAVAEELALVVAERDALKQRLAQIEGGVKRWLSGGVAL